MFPKNIIFKNMKQGIIIAAVVLFSGVIFISCAKEYSCENCLGVNQPPIAEAGSDTTIFLPTNSVTLDGSASNDPDGRISSYQWTKISGPSSCVITDSSIAITDVNALVAGIYRFELEVTDNSGLFTKDTVQITVTAGSQSNQPPIANAGSDQIILLSNDTANLDGSGSADPDNNIVSYLWTKISGPSTFNIQSPNAAQSQVTNLDLGDYIFELQVTDAGGLISKDTMEVKVVTALSGQEIIYHSGWGCNDLCRDGDVYWDSGTWPYNSYSGFNAATLQVAIQLAASTVWIDVYEQNSPSAPPSQFFWVINESGFLFVFAYDARLISTPVTVRVRF